MAYNKIIFFLFISLAGMYGQEVRAQALNINGDTIFVNMEAEVQIIFPALPTSYSTTPSSAGYHIWNVKKGIYVIPGSPDCEPASLLVSEGGRDHRFILVFKKDINNDEARLYYDYSTVEKLANHISERALALSVPPSQATIKIEPSRNNRKRRVKEIEAKALADTSSNHAKALADTSSNYYDLLEKGDREFGLQNYQDASVSYDKAHALRPGNTYPLNRLEEIKSRLAEKESLVQAENKRKYIAITSEAKYAFDQKNYGEAMEAYKKALELQPQDPYATQQLQAIDLLLRGKPQNQKANNQEAARLNIRQGKKALGEKQLIQENYDVAIKAADNYFEQEKYDSAKALYSKALNFIKKNWPASQINKINRIIHEQSLKALEDNKRLALQLRIELAKNDTALSGAEIKKNYNLALAKGKSSFIKNDLVNSKIFYEQALKLQPSGREPINQLKIINKKLEEEARETEINNTYDRKIAFADSLAIAQAYESAIISYKEASTIKPLESYPKKEIRYMQSELASKQKSIEKRKQEEEEQRYNDALTRAEKAVADKRYDDAKSAYTEALTIHPGNEYAKRRLEIVSYQAEKARLDKLAEDSLKKVTVPLKKSKRKKFS